MKEESGNPKLGLVYLSAMNAIARVREFGNKKHGHRENWREVSREIYFDAALRHLMKAKAAELDRPSGENSIDKESGLSHLSHVLVNVMFLIEGEEPKKKVKNEQG